MQCDCESFANHNTSLHLRSSFSKPSQNHGGKIGLDRGKEGKAATLGNVRRTKEGGSVHLPSAFLKREGPGVGVHVCDAPLLITPIRPLERVQDRSFRRSGPGSTSETTESTTTRQQSKWRVKVKTSIRNAAVKEQRLQRKYHRQYRPGKKKNQLVTKKKKA